MIHPAIPLTFLALVVPAAVPADGAGEGPRGGRGTVMATQLTIHERIVIRVPRLAAPPVSRPTPPIETAWKEKKGPRCILPGDVGGAIFGRREQVDLVMIGGRRLRAKLDHDCGPIDFYAGVYIRPGSDGKICADRDAIRTRSGATCDIDAFKTLVARR